MTFRFWWEGGEGGAARGREDARMCEWQEEEEWSYNTRYKRSVLSEGYITTESAGRNQQKFVIVL
jgi:hypothetical protein